MVASPLWLPVALDSQRVAIAPKTDEVFKLRLVKGFKVTVRSNFWDLKNKRFEEIISQFGAKVVSKTCLKLYQKKVGSSLKSRVLGEQRHPRARLKGICTIHTYIYILVVCLSTYGERA